MNKTYSIIKIIFCLLLFLNSFTIVVAQSKPLAKHIEEKLISIDKLIANKDYNLALSKLEDIESYSNYISIKANKLNIDLKRAQAHYRGGDQDEAMNILLNNFNQLNEKENSEYYIKYGNYLGEIFNSVKNYERSLFYYRQILQKATLIKDTVNIAKSYLEMGSVFYRKGDLDSSDVYYKKVTEFNVNSKIENEVSKAYNNLGVIASDIQDFDLAQEYGEKFLKIKQLQKDTVEIAAALINLSAVLYEKGEFSKAENYYLEAHESLKDKTSEKSLIILNHVLLNLAYVNEQLKEYDKAYYYLESATELKDSLAEINIAKNISEVEAKYNVAKEAQKTEEEKSKRQRTQYLFYGSIFLLAISLVLAYIFYRNYRLKQENELDKVVNETQIKIINATIDAKENERKSIAETLHDSVSALLSSANLHLQATKAQLKTGYPQEITKAQTIVNEASVKIRDLSHELISSVLLKFGLAFAVHDMCQKYSNSEISLFSDDDGIKRYEQNFEIKIHNIIEELVNNILKHSKAKNASIILAHRDNNMLSIRMNDDGVGFDAKSAKMKGGLGLSHIDARIKVMKGVFNIVSSKDNGTSIFILVPIVSREV